MTTRPLGTVTVAVVMITFGDCLWHTRLKFDHCHSDYQSTMTILQNKTTGNAVKAVRLWIYTGKVTKVINLPLSMF